MDKDKDKNTDKNTDKLKIAIAVLTRGYPSPDMYTDLVKRNRAIQTLVHDRFVGGSHQLDCIVFHEGNIPADHQSTIQAATPGMPMRFVDVHATPSRAFREENTHKRSADRTIETPLSMAFPLGYKHMCHFWFIDFLDCCAAYDYVVRVDEDCVVSKFPSVLKMVQGMREEGVRYLVPMVCDSIDAPAVTVGLPQLAHDFLVRKGLPVCEWKKQQLPYTNMFVVDVQFFRGHKLYKEFAERVHESGGIYVNRWGDLPLWGVVVSNMIPKAAFVVEKNICYYHASHGKTVNGSKVL